MKMTWLILGTVSAFALMMIQDLGPAYGASPLPALAGGYSITIQGSETLCVGDSCGAGDETIVVENLLSVGQITQDHLGNGCGTVTQTLSASGTEQTPTVTPLSLVSTITSYNPATGVGDENISFYTGGTCSGASFNNTGATLFASGTSHFAVSRKRIDLVVTTLTDPGTSNPTPGNDIGTFNLSSVALKQPGGEEQ